MNSIVQDDQTNWGSRGTAGVSIPAALSFDNVAVNYGAKAAVNGVSFDINPGEIICLLGRSGCGKTSLLRLAAGLLRPDSGTISVNQKTVSGQGVHILPEHRHVGLMFQDYALFEHMNNVKNVEFGLHGLDHVSSRAQAELALARVGLQSRAKDFPGQLSGGEQQRLALARAIAPRPSILLMDEPFSGLDPQLRVAIRNETHAVLRETGATSIVVTHDPQEAMVMGDRIILMNAGRIHQIGTPAELYNQPVDLFAARFFSAVSPLNSDAFEVKNGSSLREKSIGVRPEHVQIVAEKHIGEPGVFGGRITNVRFSGLYDLIEVATDIADAPVLAYAFDVGRHKKGGVIGVQINQDKLLVFNA